MNDSPKGMTRFELEEALHQQGCAVCRLVERAGNSYLDYLLYDLVNAANEPDIKAMLDNVVVLLWPTINPDGQQMVAEFEAVMAAQDAQIATRRESQPATGRASLRGRRRLTRAGLDARFFGTEKFPVGDRLHARPNAARTAEIGNAGFR